MFYWRYLTLTLCSAWACAAPVINAFATAFVNENSYVPVVVGAGYEARRGLTARFRSSGCFSSPQEDDSLVWWAALLGAACFRFTPHLLALVLSMFYILSCGGLLTRHCRKGSTTPAGVTLGPCGLVVVWFFPLPGRKARTSPRLLAPIRRVTPSTGSYPTMVEDRSALTRRPGRLPSTSQRAG